MRRLIAMSAVVIGLGLSSCGGDDDGASKGSSTAPPVELPSEGATTPSEPGALPPEIVECFANEGFDEPEIHSAPLDVQQACFGAGH